MFTIAPVVVSGESVPGPNTTAIAVSEALIAQGFTTCIVSPKAPAFTGQKYVYAAAPGGVETGVVVITPNNGVAPGTTAFEALWVGSCADACGRPESCPCLGIGACGTLPCPVYYGAQFIQGLQTLAWDTLTSSPTLGDLLTVCPTDGTDGCEGLPTSIYVVPGVRSLKDLGFCAGPTGLAQRADGGRAFIDGRQQVTYLALPNSPWYNPCISRSTTFGKPTAKAAAAYEALGIAPLGATSYTGSVCCCSLNNTLFQTKPAPRTTCP